MSRKWFLKWLIIGAIIVLAVILRCALFGYRSSDYILFLNPWYGFIKSHGGFAALKYPFGDYAVSYLYLLALATYIPFSNIVVIKSISIIFDLVLALFTYLIVRLKYEKTFIAIFAVLLILFTPTVFINSALWGQSDSIYTSFSVGGLYFLLRKQSIWAFVLFGLAISFKLQAIFLFPLLFVLLITKQVHIKYFVIIPGVFLISILPAYFLGRGLMDLLNIYPVQMNEYHGLNLFAPNIFQWIPPTSLKFWRTVGILLAFSAVVILSLVVLASRRKVTNAIILKLAFIFVLIVPFLLPGMHERYFYLADVISLIYAFYFPDYFYVVILIQISSLLSYISFLMGIINLQYVALLPLGLIVVTVWDLLKTLYSPPQDGVD